MIQAKCIYKIRNKSNKIVGYRLIDLNNNVQDIESNNLKLAISQGKIHVVNLTLSKDGRLMDTTEKLLPYKEDKKATIKENSSVVNLAKAFTIIEYSYIDMGDSFREVVEIMCYDAKLKFYEEYEYNEDELKKLLTNAHKKLLIDNPTYLPNRLKTILSDSDYYSDRIKSYMHSEQVSKLTDSEMYKAICLIYTAFKDSDKQLAKLIKTKLIDNMR